MIKANSYMGDLFIHCKDVKGVEVWQGYYQLIRGKMMINIDLSATVFLKTGRFKIMKLMTTPASHTQLKVCDIILHDKIYMLKPV